jgi:hypothetical protein
MSTIRKKFVNAKIQKAYALTDNNILENIDEYYKLLQKSILSDDSLTSDEKSETMKVLNVNYDSDKIRCNKGKKRICKICKKECLATLYCECCIRNYLKSEFSNWTSENDNIDNLI